MVHLAQKETGLRDQKVDLELITTHENNRAPKRHPERQRTASHGGGRSNVVSISAAAASRAPTRNPISQVAGKSPVLGAGFPLGNLHAFSSLTTPIIPEDDRLRPTPAYSPQEQLSHPTAGPEYYTCNICDKKFSIPSHLKRHQKDHDKPEVCMKCDQQPRFPTKSELRRHEESRHPTQRFYCMKVPCKYNKPLAPKTGLFLGGLTKIRRHLKDVHQITSDIDTWIEECSDEPVQNLAERLLSVQIEQPEGSNAYFIPVNQLDSLLVEANVRQQMRKIYPTMEEKSLDFYTDTICSSSKKLFAALICTSSGALSQAICSFIQEGINDTDLPFSRLYLIDKKANVSSTLNRVYTLAKRTHDESCTRTSHASCGINVISNWSRDQVQSLSRDQWRVLAPIFESEPGTRPPDIEISGSAVLPFTEDHENDPGAVKFGGYSEVWAVRIHPAHQKMLRPTSRSEPDDDVSGPLIAVKRLISRDSEVFERERHMLSQLTLKNHPHLVRLLITYTYKGKFHLLYPYAQYNLRDYWRNHAKPMERDTCLWALQQICGLASALSQIHNFSTKPTVNKSPENSRERSCPNPHMNVDTDEEIFGRHGDLKPENILWLSGLEEVDPLGILQITDFGLGRFHGLKSRSCQDPASINGSPTYCPPELLLGNPVSRAYDIWSLGCLYLEFITWIIDGHSGVEEFADARLMTAFDGVEDDTYYTLVVSDTGRQAEVREAVTNWMETLRSNQCCSQMVNELLDLLQNRMLQVVSKDRISAKELDSILKKMLDSAKANTVYLLGDVRPDSVSKTSASTKRPKNVSTLTDRTRSQPMKRRLKLRPFER